MKIAILGNTPIALEAALKFHSHGAALTWYQNEEEFAGFKSPQIYPNEFVTDLGISILSELGLKYAPEFFSWENWQENYYNPLVTYLRLNQEVKREDILSVAKRFLAPGEVIKGRSRFLDHFRVIYSVDPRAFIEQQRETNPEAYARMTAEVISSLGTKMEMYNNFDLVLDLRAELGKASLSTSGRAVGEGRETEKVSYALDALRLSATITPSPDMREICLVGSNAQAAEILINLTEWMKDLRSRLFVVSHEEAPLDTFIQNANSGTSEKLQALLTYIDEEFKLEVDKFTKKLREWQELDDFVQVKVSKPAEPIPRLNFFSGHNVIAADELVDKKRLFLTLENPSFREAKKHSENNFLELKTIGADHVFVGHGKKDSSFITLDRDEVGFFAFAPTLPNIKDSWAHDLKNLEGIEDEIFKLFTPATSSQL